MQTTLLFLIALLLIGQAVALVWLWREGRATCEHLAVILASLRPVLHDDLASRFGLIAEQPPMSAERGLEFFKGLQINPVWPHLAHRYQYAARDFLHRVQLEAGQGHEAAAMMWAGAAWYASREATMPAREIDTCLAVLKAQEAERLVKEKTDRATETFRARHIR